MSLTLIRDILLGHGIKPCYVSNCLKYQVSINGEHAKMIIELYEELPGWFGCDLVTKQGTTWFSDRPNSMIDRILNYYCIKPIKPRSKL